MAFDGFDNPVGWNRNQAGPVVWAENYEDVNPFGTQYHLGFHTGADLNDNHTHGWDSDKLAAVYAIGNGTVTHAGQLGGSWGNVVVIDHGHCMSRYAHLDNFTVQAGANVVRGQQIGQIGNAFGKFSYHLHFDISLTRILLNHPGHWPGNNLEAVVKHYVEPRSFISISRPKNPIQPGRVKGYTTGNVNFRCGPSTSFRIYKSLFKGETVTILQEFNGWKLLQLNTEEFGWSYGAYVSEGIPDEEPLPSVYTAVGIHASADGGRGVGWEQPVRGEIVALQPEVVKFQSSHDPQVIDTIVSDNKHHIQMYIVRAFLSWGDRRLTSKKFVDSTISDTKRSVDQIKAHGVPDKKIIIELHNEPNLMAEGLSFSWQNGTECVEFFTDVLDQYKTQMPNVQYGLGALSPGGEIRHIRRDSTVFLEEMLRHPRWGDFDVHLVHLYTRNNWENDIWWLDHCQTKTPTMPIWVTESSWHVADNTPGVTYAAKLVELVNLLDRRPTKGITFYCISGSNSEFFHEVWCRGQDRANPQKNMVSRDIAAELRRLRPLPLGQ